MLQIVSRETFYNILTLFHVKH